VRTVTVILVSGVPSGPGVDVVTGAGTARFVTYTAPSGPTVSDVGRVRPVMNVLRVSSGSPG